MRGESGGRTRDPTGSRAPTSGSADASTETAALYRANGLTLLSEVDLPEFRPAHGRPDITVRFGTAPEELESPALRAPRAQASPGEYLLTVDGVGRYWVRDGRRVVVHPAPDAGEDDVRVFLLSSVMGVLAHMNDFLPLHASAVAIDGRCVLFAGGSGTGKSTLAAVLARRGHTVVADDLCAISLDSDGAPMVQPGYRHLKLWDDALRHVGNGLGEPRPVRPGTNKYSVLLSEPGPVHPIPVRRIFVLTPELVRLHEGVTVNHLRGRAKVAALLRETYRFRLVGGLGTSERHLELCQAVGRTTPVEVVRRALHPSHLPGTVQLLEELVQKEVGEA